MAHYLKGLDTQFYWTLNSYLSKRLYRLIDQMRGADLDWGEDLFELQKQLPLAGYQYVSKIMQVLAPAHGELDRKSTRLNSSHANISYAVFCLKKKTTMNANARRSSTV